MTVIPRPVRSEGEQDAWLDKVRRIRNKVHAMNTAAGVYRNSVKPRDGQGLVMTSYSSVFWVGRHLRDPEARQLKELTDDEFENLLNRLENDEYETANA